MNPIPTCVYRLELFTSPPDTFEGKLFSFTPIDGAMWIDLSSDPFESIKKAAASALGSPAGLIIQGFCFFTELFISLYHQFSLVYLEIKEDWVPQLRAFLSKQDNCLEAVSFKNASRTPVILIGKADTLHQEIDKILEMQKKALIACCYSVLPILEEYGIKADLAFAFDPNQQKHVSKAANYLVISAKTKTSICEGFNNVALFPETYCSFSSLIFKNHPQPPVYGFTIIDTALKFLLQKGFKEVFLAGVDFSEIGGVYADKTPCGFKPDFKKAKEHIDWLKEQHKNILNLDDGVFLDQEIKKDIIFSSPLGIEDSIKAFKQSYAEALKIDFKTLGLYEMFLLEQELFYQIVLDPLYTKWSLIDKEKCQDKRVFFQDLINKFKNLSLNPQEDVLHENS